MPKAKQFVVEIVRYVGEVVEKRIDAGPSRRVAEKVDRGVNINLNHRQFYTRLVEAG